MKKEKKSILSWALYDWANSAYTTTIMAGFFPLFFKKYWANPANPTESTFYLAIANSTASIIIALLAPVLGAIADRGSAKKKFLGTFAYFGVLMTAGLWMVQQGFWELAVFFYVAATVGWSGANIFYDALLPAVATRQKVDWVSSLGFGLGYIGGGILFLLNVLMFLKYPLFGIPDEATAIKLSFLSVAIWWAGFSLPVFFFVKEPRLKQALPIKQAISAGWNQLRGTLSDLRHFRIIALFLLAYWLYIDGVDTIVRMAIDYGMSIGLQPRDLMMALLIVQFVGFPAALVYGWLATKIGTKNAVLSAIGGYVFITFFGYFMQSELHFYFLAVLVALFQGGIQALSRSLYTRIIPHSKAAEFFGFYNMLGKFAVVIGPLLMGFFTYVTGNIRIGILSILSLFAVGGILLWRVNIEKGEQLAQQFVEPQ